MAKEDGREFVSEWYIMLSLLRFNTVRNQFNDHDKLKDELFLSARQETDRKFDANALFEDVEGLRESAGDNLPSPSHFARVLHHIGTDELKETMNRRVMRNLNSAEL